MGAAFSLGIIAIAVTVFFGLGGVQRAEGLYADLTKGKSRTAIGGDKPPSFAKKPSGTSTATTTEKIEKSNPKTPVITSAVRKTNQVIQNAKKLDERKNRKSPRIRFLKKSGAEVVRERQREEVKAKEILKAKGATYGGIGKYGRKKLYGNSNFDLGLPSDATREERAKVLRDTRLRNAQRRFQAKKKEREQKHQLKLEGKSQAELQEIARAKGLNVHGNLSPKSLAKILERLN